MAFRFTVDHQNLSLVVETDATEPITTFVHTNSPVTYQFAQALSAYELAAFSVVYLDPDTKNLYLTAQFDSPNAVAVTLSDVFTKAVQFRRTFADTYTFDEGISNKAIGKVLSDAATLSEAFTRVVQFNRGFSESPTLSDSPVKGITIPSTDTYDLSESSIRSVSLGKSETITPSDSSSLLVAVAPSDSLTLAEAFSRVVQFARTFADAFTLDDTASVTDVLKTDIIKTKANVIGVTETLAQAVSKPLTDTVSVAEAFVYSAAISASETVNVAESSLFSFASVASETASMSEALASSFSQSLGDSATISESVNVLLIAPQAALLNVTVLNAAVLNEAAA